MVLDTDKMPFENKIKQNSCFVLNTSVPKRVIPGKLRPLLFTSVKRNYVITKDLWKKLQTSIFKCQDLKLKA